MQKKMALATIILIFVTTIGYSQPIGILSGDLRKSKLTDRVIMWSKIEASSYLIEQNQPKTAHDQYNVSDGNMTTAWCEGVPGPGIGEWVKMYFNLNKVKNEIYLIWRFSIINGFADNEKLYYANNRVKKIRIEFSEGDKVEIELKDGILDYQQFKFINKKIWAKWARITILEVYKGEKYNDTCISEIDFEDARSTTEMWGH